MAKPNITLIFGIIQVVAGLVLVGLYSAEYHETITKEISKEDITKAQYFGPIIVGILVVVNGGIGIFAAVCQSDKLDLLYMLGTVASATASAALVYQYALVVATCRKTIGEYNCPAKQTNRHITLLTFNTISCLVGILGMVVMVLRQCRK